MGSTQIEDKNFGTLTFNDGWGWCSTNFLWDDAQYISICIDPINVENGVISKAVWEHLKLLRINQTRITRAALEQLDCFELINEWLSDDNGGVVIDVDNFLHYISLEWAMLNSTGESELQYITGGPLLRIFVSPELVVSDVFFDGLM